MIVWTKLDREKWDRAVEALMFRHYAAAGDDCQVRIYDGSGGDGGRDIEVVFSNGYRIILQLKHFPEGFSSNWQPRRRQIAKSFKAALKHEPDEWILVVPKKLAPGERTFVENLSRYAHGRVPRIESREQTWLDTELAKHPDIEDAINRDEWERFATFLPQIPNALPPGRPAEVIQAVVEVQRRLESVDPNWVWDFATVDGKVHRTLRAKTPNAHLIDPVSVEIETWRDQLSVESLDQIEAIFGYGLDGQAEFPPAAVKNLQVKGPPLVAETAKDVAVIFWRPPSNPAVDTCRIEVWVSGRQVGEHNAQVVHYGEAAEGHSFRIKVAGCLEIALRMPRVLSAVCKTDVKYQPTTAQSAGTTAEALGFLINLADGAEIRLFAEEQRFAVFVADGSTLTDIEAMRTTVSFARDLEIMNRMLGKAIQVPASYSHRDRAMLRALVLMLQGNRTLLPGWSRLPIVVEHDDLDKEGAAGLTRGEPACGYMVASGLTIPLLGREIVLPEIWIGHEAIVLENHARIREALIADPNRPVSSYVRRQDGNVLTGFLSDFVPERGTPPVIVTEWGLGELDGAAASS